MINLIEVNVNKLCYWPRAYDFDRYIKNYLSSGIMKKFKLFYKYERSKKYINYQEFLGIYAKNVWLTKEYIKNNKQFKYPLGLKWDSESQLWKVHPGGHRSTVIYYFPTKTTLGLTLDKVSNSVMTFSSVNDLIEYYNTEEIGIPKDNSVYIDSSTQYTSINDTIKDMKNFFQSTEVCANFNLQEYGYNKKILIRKKRSIRVSVNDPTDKMQVIRAFLLMPYFKSFNDYGVKIERI